MSEPAPSTETAPAAENAPTAAVDPAGAEGQFNSNDAVPSTPRNDSVAGPSTPVNPVPTPVAISRSVQRNLRPTETIYERCFRNIAEGKRCNGDFGTFSKKKCFRCVKLHRPCRELHSFLIPPANRQFRARDALAALKRRGSGATEAQIDVAIAELAAANAHCKDQLKRFHTNRNSVVGETRTPNGKSVAAAHGSGAVNGTIAAMSLEEMQKIRSLMEDGLGLLSSVLVNGVGGDHKVVLDKIALKRGAMWEEESDIEAEDEAGEEDEDEEEEDEEEGEEEDEDNMEE